MHVYADQPVAPVAANGAPAAAPAVTGPGPIPVYGSDSASFTTASAPAKAESAGTWDKVKAWWSSVYRSDENIAAWKAFETDMEKRPQAYIKPGEKGPKVLQFQEKLKALGVDTNVNGVYGPATQSQVSGIKAQLNIDDGYLDADGNPVRSAVVTPQLMSAVNGLLRQKEGHAAQQPAAGTPAAAQPVQETVTPEELAEYQAAQDKMKKFGFKPSGQELARLQDIERRINALKAVEAQAQAKIQAMIQADGPVSLEELKTVQPYIEGLQAGTVQEDPLLNQLVIRLQERAQKHGVTKEAAEAAQAEKPAAPAAPAQEIPEQPVTTYTIKPGDTLRGIADSFGTSVEVLRAANPGKKMVVGAQILIPLPEIPEDAPVAAPKPNGGGIPQDVPSYQPAPVAAPQANKPPMPPTATTAANNVLSLTFGQLKDNLTWAQQIEKLNNEQGVSADGQEQAAYKAVMAQWSVVEPLLVVQPAKDAGPVQPAKPMPALAAASWSQVQNGPISGFKEALEWALFTHKHRILAKAGDVTPQEQQAVDNTFKNLQYLQSFISDGQYGVTPPGGSAGPAAGPTATGGTIKVKANDPRAQMMIALFEKKKSGQPLSETDLALYDSLMAHYQSMN